MSKYIDAEKLKEMLLPSYEEAKMEKSHILTDGVKWDKVEYIFDFVFHIIDSLQSEVDLDNKFGWHNVSEKTPKFGDYVIVACKNKNKKDGIWLYDLIHCWEGKWEPRENWETPLKWISVDELGLNARKEE